MDIEKIVTTHPGVTDIHITEDSPVMIRQYGNLKKCRDVVTHEDFDALFQTYVSEKQKEIGTKIGGCDSSFSIGNTRFRLHIYRSGGKWAAALRILPVLSTIGNDPDQGWIEKIAALDHGLVLITGASGSGKSTTLARITSWINQKRPCHIITLEDPVEYEIPSEKALVHQREIGRDVVDFPRGIQEALREDPDVIVLGEMRDAETMGAALTAAETGHLVLGTLHTTRAKDAIGRMIHAFPGDRERDIRSLLAANLSAVAAQELYRSGKETYLLREIMTNVPAISHLIREGKEEQIPSYMEMGLQHMRTMKQAVYQLKGISEREREKMMKAVMGNG